MEVYIQPIVTACYLFPFMALLFTLPYIVHQYHKHGAILMIRTGIIYSFIFYMMTSFFMTVLPLPNIDSVTPTSATVLLVPFDAVVRSVQNSSFTTDNPMSFFSIFVTMDFLQIVFNIILLVPFGVYLRYYFEKRWYVVFILSFLYSLFFEITQVTGLYWIYPYPYRFFEVDDLIANTLGGMVGFWITPLIVFFLPSKKRMDEVAYERSEKVSIFRRSFALMLDYGILMFAMFLVYRFTPVYDMDIRSKLLIEIGNRTYSFLFLLLPVCAVVAFTFVNIITGGYTIGKYIVNIRIIKKDDKGGRFRANPFVYMIRNVIVHGFIISAPTYIGHIFSMALGGTGIVEEMFKMRENAGMIGIRAAVVGESNSFLELSSIYTVVGIVVLAVLILVVVVDIFIAFFGVRHRMIYDVMLGLKVINTTRWESKSSSELAKDKCGNVGDDNLNETNVDNSIKQTQTSVNDSVD